LFSSLGITITRSISLSCAWSPVVSDPNRVDRRQSIPVDSSMTVSFRLSRSNEIFDLHFGRLSEMLLALERADYKDYRQGLIRRL
jgi:hypothetical protein